jgi:putative IMPACT (imprinted ancient) family translation regulator
VATHLVMAAVPYNLLERVRLLIGEHHGRILDETFAADVTLTIQFRVDQFEPFQAGLRELSNGLLAAEIVETDPATIVPLVGRLDG